MSCAARSVLRTIAPQKSRLFKTMAGVAQLTLWNLRMSDHIVASACQKKLKKDTKKLNGVYRLLKPTKIVTIT